MFRIEIDEYCVGQVQTNCYILANKETGEALVVDPGDQAQMLIQELKAKNRKPVAVLLTHGHFDHAMAAAELTEEFGIPIYAHALEQDTLENPSYNLSGMIGRKEAYHADVYVQDGQELELAGVKIRVLLTPGHTPGGCCYYIPGEDILFSGDTLFNQSVGRTDFPRGSMGQIVRSIREKLLVLPDHIKVYPGHMDATTIGQEREWNPFI